MRKQSKVRGGLQYNVNDPDRKIYDEDRQLVIFLEHDGGNEALVIPVSQDHYGAIMEELKKGELLVQIYTMQ